MTEETSRRYRILFVDDEQSILDGLSDSLRKQRKQWDMVFALGGVAALQELDRAEAGAGSFDVVVSDMRMPMMDGATLLARVKERYPACIRIILSGHAERESVVQALPVAHQFLSKPCTGEQLRAVIGRACELQRLLQDDAIRRVIGKLDRLPSVPQTYWNLTAAAARPDVPLAELARIMEQDPAMSVKVLQLVNSSYFGIAQRLTSVQQAVSYLGIELIKSLALVVHTFGIASTSDRLKFSLEELQLHSLMTAHLSKRLVSDPKLAGEAFTASVIHDVGQIILALAIPDAYAEMVRAAHASNRPYHLVERELLGFTHAEVGAFLLGSWGLPLSVVEAVAFHHTPSLVPGQQVAVLTAVHSADALVDAVLSKRPFAPLCGSLDVAFIERVGLLEEVPRWTELATAITGGAV